MRKTHFNDDDIHKQTVMGQNGNGDPMPSANFWSATRRYLLWFGILMLVWEIIQLPLYTIWTEASIPKLIFAIIHCTAGDLLIGTSALLGAVWIVGRDWPTKTRLRVTLVTIAAGLLYTVYSEAINTARGTWTYSELMPRLPVIGIGVAPLLQWIVIPAIALQLITRQKVQYEA